MCASAAPQGILDAVLFEPGRYLDLGLEGRAPAHVPATRDSDRALLASAHGHLLNELHRAPRAACDAVLALLRLALDLDGGTVHSTTVGVILYVARLGSLHRSSEDAQSLCDTSSLGRRDPLRLTAREPRRRVPRLRRAPRRSHAARRARAAARHAAWHGRGTRRRFGVEVDTQGWKSTLRLEVDASQWKSTLRYGSRRSRFGNRRFRYGSRRHGLDVDVVVSVVNGVDFLAVGDATNRPVNSRRLQ